MPDKFITRNGYVVLDGDTLKVAGRKRSLPVHAEVQSGEKSRTTATRVATGAVLGGGVGALVGAIAKKSQGKTYLVLQGDGWTQALEISKNRTDKAIAFAQKINAASSAA